VTCQEMADFLADYIGEELDAEVRLTFEHHIAKCHNCHVFLDQYRTTIVAGRAAYAHLDREQPPVTEVPEALVQAILEALKKSS